MLPHDGRVMRNFIMQALKGELLTLSGDGSQTRTPCYVDDLHEGMIRLMNGSHIGPMNMGNQGEFTIRQLAERGSQPYGAGTHHSGPLPQDDPLQRQPVIDLAMRELGWQTMVALENPLEPINARH